MKIELSNRSGLRLCAGSALAACALSPTLASAQAMEIKPVRIEYEYYPSASVHGLDAASPQSEAHFQSARASLSLPTPVGKRSLLIPALRYQLLDIGAQPGSSATSASSVDALHSLTLSLGVLQPLGSDFSLFAQLGGGLARELSSEVASDDWVVSAQLLGLWALHEDFTLGAGVGYDRRTGDVTPLPLVAFSWEPRSDLLLRGVVPQFLSLRYRPDSAVTLAADATLEGERYHLSRESAETAHGEVAHSVAKLGPSLTLHWTSRLHKRENGGIVLSRRFELYVDDVSQGDLSTGKAPFAGIELWFGPSGWSSDAVETALADASRVSAESRRRAPGAASD